MLVLLGVLDHGSACVTPLLQGLLWPPYLPDPVETQAGLPGPTASLTPVVLHLLCLLGSAHCQILATSKGQYSALSSD